MVVRKTSSPARDVVQREFSVVVAGEQVPCVLWAPVAKTDTRSLVAMGHGGSQHKKARSIRTRAIHYAGAFGWASLAIDAPRHGDRTTREEAEDEREKTQARVRGDQTVASLTSGEKIDFLDGLAAQAVPEWQAALDATLADFLPRIESLGYWGVSQGTWIGVPLLAAEKRIGCAVLGLSQLHPDHVALRGAARKVTIPLRFAFQWDDPIRNREYGIALFEALGSSEKSMHINTGGHAEIPETEAESWDHFFQRYLK